MVILNIIIILIIIAIKNQIYSNIMILVQIIIFIINFKYLTKIKIILREDHIIIQDSLKTTTFIGFKIDSIELKETKSKIPEILTSINKDWNKNVKISYELNVSKNKPAIYYYIIFNGTIKDKSIVSRELSKIHLLIYNQYKNANITRLTGKDLQKRLHISALFSKKINKKIYQTKNEYITIGIIKGIPTKDNNSINELMKYLLHINNVDISFRITFWPKNEKITKYKIKKKYVNLKKKDITSKEYYIYEKLYDELTRYESWWNSSIDLIVISKKSLEYHKAGIENVIHQIETIFSESNFTVSVKLRDPSKTILNYLKNGKSFSQGIGTLRLSTYLTLPTIQLPQIVKPSFPEFIIPDEKDVSGPIYIGDAIFDRKPIFSVGIQTDYLTRHMAVFGQTGSGKSTFVKCLLDEIQRKTDIPFMILDYKGEYISLMTTSPKKIIFFKPSSKDFPMHINLFSPIDNSIENHATRIYSIIKEILDFSTSSELTPAMEKLLLKSLKSAMKNKACIFEDLIREIKNDEDSIQASKDALISRLQPFLKPPLANIFNQKENQIDISSLMNKRVIIDLSQIRITGNSKDVQLFVNILTSFVFISALKRGFYSNLKHLLIIEEAHFLVPEIYSRKTSAEMGTSEDIVLLERATGEGVIVISSRPNISKNIIANTATKIAFRVPYDIDIIKKFMMLSDESAEFLKYAPIGHAIVVMPHILHPFLIKTNLCDCVKFKAEPDQIKQDYKKKEDLISRIISEIDTKGFLLYKDLINYAKSISVDSKYVQKIIKNLIQEHKITKCYSPLLKTDYILTNKMFCEKISRKILIKYIITLFQKLNIDFIINPIDKIDILTNRIAISIVNNELELTNKDNLTQYKKAILTIGNGAEIHLILTKDSLTAEALNKIIEKYEFFSNSIVLPAFPQIIDKIAKLIIEDKISDIWKLHKIII